MVAPHVMKVVTPTTRGAWSLLPTGTLTSTLGTFWNHICFKPSFAQSAVTHYFVGDVEPVALAEAGLVTEGGDTPRAAVEEKVLSLDK